MKWCVCVCVCVCVYMCVCCNPDPNETVWMWAFLLCRASRIHLQCCVRICSHLCAYGRSHFCKVCLTVIHVYLNSHLCQCIFEQSFVPVYIWTPFVPVNIWTVICASVYLNSHLCQCIFEQHLCQWIFEQSFVPVYIWTVICASVYLNSHLCQCIFEQSFMPLLRETMSRFLSVENNADLCIPLRRLCCWSSYTKSAWEKQ